MKKLLVAILTFIIGTMGYVVVDRTTDERILELEATVSEQQSIISQLQTETPDIKDLKTGDFLPCSHKSGDIFWVAYADHISPDNTYDENIKASIDDFSCVLKEFTSNGYPIFEIKLKGHLINHSYTGRITAALDFGVDSSLIDGEVNDDGVFEIVTKSDIHGYRTILKYNTITLTSLTIWNGSY